MIPAFNVAVSGLDAAAKRVEVAASNIANQSSSATILSDGRTVDKPYLPQQVNQVSLASGGVMAGIDTINTPVALQAANSGGLSSVDTATELTNINIASYDFKANLKTLQTQDKIQQSLLDIIS